MANSRVAGKLIYSPVTIPLRFHNKSDHELVEWCLFSTDYGRIILFPSEVIMVVVVKAKSIIMVPIVTETIVIVAIMFIS